MIIPSVNIYRSKETGRYLLQELMPTPDDGSAECGNPAIVEESEFEERIPGAVFEAPANYESHEQVTKSEHRFGSDRQALQFAKQHLW